MAFRFVALFAAVACVSTVAAFPKAYPKYVKPAPAPAPCGNYAPEVVTSVVPGPVNIGPDAAGVLGHASAPYELNYFEKPWIVKHQQSAALNVYTQTPVVVDEYAAPSFSEGPAAPAVIVEEVYGPATQIAGAPATYAAEYAAPAYAAPAYAKEAYPAYAKTAYPAYPSYGCY